MHCRFADNEFESAYNYADKLRELNPTYEGVVDKCAELAYKISKSKNAPTSLQHREEWLQRVIFYRPNYDSGIAQQKLDETQYLLGLKHIKDGELEKAAKKICEIPASRRSPKTKLQLAQLYLNLGNQMENDEEWQRAVHYWSLAIGEDPDLEHLLASKCNKAKFRAWIKSYQQEINFVTAIGAIVAIVAAVFTAFQWLISRLELNTSTPVVATSLPSSVIPPTFIVVTAPFFDIKSPTLAIDPARTQSPTSTLTPTPTQTKSQIPTNEPLFMSCVVNVDNLVLRGGPGGNHDIMGYLKRGDKITWLGRTADNWWLNVMANNNTGWLAADKVVCQLQITQIPTVSSTPPSPKPIPTPTFTPSLTELSPIVPVVPTNTPTSTKRPSNTPDIRTPIP